MNWPWEWDWGEIGFRGLITLSVFLFVALVGMIFYYGQDHSERICVPLRTGDHLWLRDLGPSRPWLTERYLLESQAPGSCP